MPLSEGAKGFIGTVSVLCGQMAVIWVFLEWFRRQDEKAKEHTRY